MLFALSAALELHPPSVSTLQEDVIDRLAHDPVDFGFGDPAICGAQLDVAPRGSGLRLVAERRIFGGGGTVAFDERIENLRPLPQAALSIEDANRLGVATADYIDLQGGEQTLHDLLVEVRPGLQSGTVVVIDGLPDEPANTVAPGSRLEVVNVRKSAGQRMAV
jgi:hypothetical protein